MRSVGKFICILFAVMVFGAPARAGNRATTTTLHMKTDPAGGRSELRIDGELVGTLRRDGARTALDGLAVVERSERPLFSDHPYPRRVRVDGRLEQGGETVREEYTLLAPAAPIDVEGWGLEVSTDEPGINAEEHAQLRDWLSARGLEGDTAYFSKLHASDTGRELTVWYEIAGRRVDGAFFIDDSSKPAARFDSLFHTTEEGWKIHHARGPFYHRKSLELVGTLTSTSESSGSDPPELRSYECGCYGWAIGADWATLRDWLFHLKVEWKHHRVGAGLFIGLQRTGSFPWFGFGERESLSRRARRAKAYRLTDAGGDLFGEIAIGLSSNPPADGLGDTTYEIHLTGADGVIEPLAQARHGAGEIVLRLISPSGSDWEQSLERLDRMLATMPTQIVRGDGIRDSHLGRIETMLDWIRLARAPSRERLADVVSEIDAANALAKIGTLLRTGGDRFSARGAEVPLPPQRHADSPFGRGGGG